MIVHLSRCRDVSYGDRQSRVGGPRLSPERYSTSGQHGISPHRAYIYCYKVYDTTLRPGLIKPADGRSRNSALS